jgi:MYXO-CTERM domain-containing protein
MPDYSLQPVLGGLDTVLTNIKALNNEMLAEDPGVVRDLLGAAVRLAQPLLAGLLKPVQLPTPFGLQIQVKGLTGAVPVSSNVTRDGYQHLAIYGGLSEACGNTVPCANYAVRTEARIVASAVPADLDEARGPNRVVPSVDIEASALSARRSSTADFSYRVDGSLWSPWVAGPRFTVRDPIFLLQGHHTIEVIAREMGDDRTQDTDPVSLDFFVSFESPTVELVQRNDGSVITKGQSVASRSDKLLYSYRFAGQHTWSTPGPARVFTAAELAGRGLQVTVTDEGGRTAMAKIGVDDAEALQQYGAAGCASSPQAVGPAGMLLALAAMLLLARRRRSA